MIDKFIPAVILGLGINGLAIVRSLAEKGIDVLGVYTESDERGRFSRYCKAIRFPALENGEDIFLQKLIKDLGNSKEKPVLYSESDLYVMFISRNRNLLGKYFRFLLPDHELLETLISKERSTTFLASTGIQIPDTFFLNGKNNIDQLLDKIKYPCLMKPVDSFSTVFEQKTLFFSEENSLKGFLNKRKELSGQVIIQQIIPGGDSNTYQATTYVSQDGSVSPIFTMRKIRQYPPNFGITSTGVSEEITQIKEKVQNFIRSVPYRGFLSLEFKKYPQTNEWFYIELNPRLPYYHRLIYDSGINFPYIYYEDMLGRKSDTTSITKQINGIQWINFAGDLGSFWRKYKEHKITMLEWVRSVIKSRSFAVFNESDIKPFLFSTFLLIEGLYKKITQNIKHYESS